MTATTRPAAARLGRPLAAAALAGWAGLLAAPAYAVDDLTFNLVRSKALPPGCAASVRASARVQTVGFAENLRVTVKGLAAGTALDLFVIQQPLAPFGLAWYLGDLPVSGTGMVTKVFTSRLSIETFAVAPGSVAAPQTHTKPPFPDAMTNPQFAPVHTYHLGVWFNSPDDAKKNGCNTPASLAVTPFNGDHTAGVQVLNTSNFGKLTGPLSRID
jgi:hypothetical protein